LESLLRVSDIAGTTVLMLALAYALGAVVQAAAALRSFARDFSMSLGPLRRLSFESFAAAVIGGAATYGVLAFVGTLIDVTTAHGVVLQGIVGGVAGLLVTATTLVLLGNREIIEAYASLRKRLVKEPPAVEATDVA